MMRIMSYHHLEQFKNADLIFPKYGNIGRGRGVLLWPKPRSITAYCLSQVLRDCVNELRTFSYIRRVYVTFLV